MFYILVLIVSYCIGCVSTSYIVTRRLSGKDIRTLGSGNAGSTNVLRSLGKKAGAMTFIGDVLKGVIAVIFAVLVSRWTGFPVEGLKAIAVIGVVCGHNWPAHMGFRGGKGVATSLGAMLAVAPLTALLCLGIFIVIVAVTKYVSLGSIVSIALSPVVASFTHINGDYKAVCVFLALSVIFTHRNNIRKLLRGEESKLGSKKK